MGPTDGKSNARESEAIRISGKKLEQICISRNDFQFYMWWDN